MSDNAAWDFLNGTLKFLNKIDEALKDKTPATKEPETMILTETRMRELKWMSPEQLDAIFGHGTKRKAVIPNDDNGTVFRQLKWLSPRQLEAIFGKDDI